MDSDWTGMTAAIARRDVLRLGAWGTMLGILSGCDLTLPKPGACQLSHPIIDVHCHVFNAADVPVEGLVRYVALREAKPKFTLARSDEEYKRRLDAFVVFMVVALGDLAPAAKSELAILERRATRPSGETIKRRQNEQLQKAFETLAELSRGDRSANEFSLRTVTGAPDYQGLLEEFAADANLPATFQRNARSMTQVDTNALAAAARSQGKFSTYFSFVSLMQEYREELARNYIRIFASKCQMSLITPSILDFEKSIGGKASSQRDQVDVMEEVQRAIAKSTGIHMHSFVGFDPHREAEHPDSAMRNVRYAILEKGFIGVKLYPPMGFKAWGNGRKIDAALARLYNWCKDNDVPIMAHAENSIGAACGYGNLASPKYWKQLLDTNKYNDLRINLAHFGAFDEVLRPGYPTGVMVSCNDDKFGGPPSWEEIIGKTFDHGRRPHLFADLSYLSELVSSEDTKLQGDIRRLLSDWLEKYDPNATQLMFGTDWSMMALEKNYNSYVSKITGELTLAGVSAQQQQNILWKNAARYLGLDRPGKTRKRLFAYCQKNHMDTDWLENFALA
jgi:predicted TIM-barrel fold metal-dependent hydrolase